MKKTSKYIIISVFGLISISLLVLLILILKNDISDNQAQVVQESITNESTFGTEDEVVLEVGTEAEIEIGTEIAEETDSKKEIEVTTALLQEKTNVVENLPSGTDSDEVFGQWVGSVLVVGKAGYETVGYSDSKADSYAQIVTDLANSLSGYSTVYSIPVPKSSGVCYDDAYASVVHPTNQGESIDKILSKMGSNVVTVDAYDTLWAHRNEYLYFRTDHHWTQLGAYYTYTEFCKAKGITAKSLSQYNQYTFEGFVGSLYRYSNYYEPFNRYPDTVYAYGPTSNATMTITNSSGSSYTYPIISDVTNSGKGNKYGCFIGGDNPISVITNSDITDGSSCVLVKESFGNAFAPFLVDHYQTVYVIDARYWNGNLVNFAKENNVNDIIILNYLSAVLTDARQNDLRSIIY